MIWRRTAGAGCLKGQPVNQISCRCGGPLVDKQSTKHTDQTQDHNTWVSTLAHPQLTGGFHAVNSENMPLCWTNLSNSFKPGQILKALSSTPSQQSSSLNNSRPGPAWRPRGKSSRAFIKTYDARCKRRRLTLVGNYRTVSWGRFWPQHLRLLPWSPRQHGMSPGFSGLQPSHF